MILSALYFELREKLEGNIKKGQSTFALMNINTNKFVSLKEVAAFLGLSQKYIYSLVEKRKIPFYKPFGKKLMFKLDEVQSIVEGSKVDHNQINAAAEDAANEYMLGRGRAIK